MSENNEKINIDDEEIQRLRSEVKDAIENVLMLNPEERTVAFLRELIRISDKI